MSKQLATVLTIIALGVACSENGEGSTDGDPTTDSASDSDSSDSDSNDGGSNDGDSNDDGTNDDGSNDGTAGQVDSSDDGSSDDGSSDGMLEQYTPDQADWSTFTTKPVEGGNPAHDPDSVRWIDEAAWAEAEWDGTIYNPSQMTHEEFLQAICPSVDRVRGIREVFYAHQPFADNANPTKAEVDEWHRIAINHVRALVGYTSEDRQVKKDHCMFARALWGDERKFTTNWDDEYPGTNGSAFGPCQGSSNAHCGATFLPSPEDQAPYLPDGHPACVEEPGSEGVFSGPKSNIPWGLKWSRGLCNTLAAEGFWGGHVEPWFHREKFGLSFWDPEPENNNNNSPLRAKWSGNAMPNLYCNPAEPDCDPDSTGP